MIKARGLAFRAVSLSDIACCQAVVTSVMIGRMPPTLVLVEFGCSGKAVCITGCFGISYTMALVPQRSLLQIDGNEFPKYQRVCFSNIIPLHPALPLLVAQTLWVLEGRGQTTRRKDRFPSRPVQPIFNISASSVPAEARFTHIISIKIPSLQGLPTIDMVTGSLMASS